jgi:hypothetical protein
MTKRSLWPLLLILSPAGAGIAAASPVRFVSGPEYLTTVLAEIDRATQSVTVCQYLFNLAGDRADSPTLRLAESLSAARARGARVEVVLNGKGGYPGGNESLLSEPERNLTAAKFLQDRGVDVFISSGPALLHAKAVVIDGLVAIVGSSNWTEAALTENVEANLLVRDPGVAGQVLADIARIPRIPVPAENIAARVPLSFLTNPSPLGALTKSSSERPFDVYLYLLMAGGGQPSFKLSYDPLIESLGLTDLKPIFARDEINRVLRRLQNRFGLIRFTPHINQDADVEIVPSTGDSVGLPPEYWSWGWCRKLTLSGKVMLLINRKYSAASRSRPRWCLSAKSIAEQTGVSVWVVTDGTTDLRRSNLVDVEYSPNDLDSIQDRFPNTYTPKPFYDPAALDRAWTDLEKRHGAEKLARAQKCAALVYADSDADAVERFISLEEEYGREKVQRAYDELAQKRPDNPRRTVGYFIQTIKRIE